MTFLPAVLFGWTLETVPVDSIGIGGWARMIAFAAVAALAPIACAAACGKGRARPAFAALLGGRRGDALDVALGIVFVALTLLSVETALGLVFDPRYRDIPFASQSGAALAYFVLMVSAPRPAGFRPAAETLAAAVLAVCAIYIAINETFANWQALWLCFGLIGLAITLVRTRVAPG
jgi:glucan 1,3-beta-glucosidase